MKEVNEQWDNAWDIWDIWDIWVAVAWHALDAATKHRKELKESTE